MNVYEAAMERISYIFKEFDSVYVSFSGGKDSGLLLHMCAEYVRRNLPGRKLGIFHMDYEAQYQMTTDYVDSTFHNLSDISEPYRCCVPFKAQTSCSMFQPYWRPWDKKSKDIWVRDMPENSYKEDDFKGMLKPGMWDYDFQEAFGEWYAQRHNGRCACLVGIRTQESMNRWRTIYSDRHFKCYNGIKWSTDNENGCINFYPIFDFTTEDIWIANGKYGYPYNKLYDLYYMAGVPIDRMRVASPFISEGNETLKLYRVIEPNTWGKLISRVNGVNFTGIYGGTTAMGWRSISKPDNMTWEQYMYFLLDTLPDDTRRRYLSKLQTSITFWRDKGGCLSSETINKLLERGVKIDVGSSSNYNTQKLPVRMDYIDEIDISEFKEIPTFKRMCVCILKNDHFCKYMGFSQTKEEVARRKNIMEKYKNLL